MSRYAVKIGEVWLQSAVPISDEARERAIRLLRKRGDGPLLSLDTFDAVIEIVPAAR